MTRVHKSDEEIEVLMSMSPQEQVDWVKKGLGIKTFIRPPRIWLDTGDPHLNKVLGSEEKGIAYGKSITLAGPYSSAKSLLGYYIGGLAQQDGAEIGIGDLENSLDPVWTRKHGLRCGKPLPGGGYSRIALFQPGAGIFVSKKKKKGKKISAKMRLEAAEDILDQMEQWVLLQRRLGKEKVFLLLDSTTALNPEEELMVGYGDQNMRTDMALPKLLNKVTKRWTQLALNCNAIIMYISQLRIDPSVMFGNPEKIPGGNGILFYPSIICKVRRVRKGLLLNSGRPCGIKSIITNIKNKSGAGSVEGLRCGFKCMFDGHWKFMSPKKVEAEL